MKNFVITIARGYGSGGSHIGRDLSKKLGIPYYDTEIIQMASDKSGINEAFFFEANENLFNYQAKILCQLALEGNQSCIITPDLFLIFAYNLY